MRVRQQTFIVFFLSFSSLFFQGCGDGSIHKFGSYNKGTHQFCTDGGGLSAYVINKNSVHSKKAISQKLGSEYENLALKLVYIDPPRSSKFLQNETFRIRSYTGVQVEATKCLLEFPYSLDKGVPLSQVTSYYYSSLVNQFSQDQELSLKGKGIYIITQAPVTGWSSQDNTIYLGKDTNSSYDSSLDASILLSLIGSANIHYASGGAAYMGSSSQHRACRGEDEMCCINKNGCSKALTIGLSHFFAASFFPEAPTIGESYSNKLTGIEDCGISRDLNQSKDISVLETFHACSNAQGDSNNQGISGSSNQNSNNQVSNSGDSGYIYPMATLYASIWWNVFKEISTQSPQKLEDFRVFYLEHLKQLQGSFTFIDAFHAMEDLDSKNFNSQFTSYFRKEFIRRGLNL